MPVIVVGADTDVGNAVVDALLPNAAQVRAFVTDPEAGTLLKAKHVKVAIGDVSDASHVGGAALNAFCAVLVTAAAGDERERSFAADPPAVLAAWAEGLTDGGVPRAIWVTAPSCPADVVSTVAAGSAPEVAVVDAAGRSPGAVATEVARLEDAARL
jgi:uncharacterized protein YbjT (DUF2867 family)